eukprot:2666709-Rhodomonas_salina.1
MNTNTSGDLARGQGRPNVTSNDPTRPSHRYELGARIAETGLWLSVAEAEGGIAWLGTRGRWQAAGRGRGEAAGSGSRGEVPRRGPEERCGGEVPRRGAEE